MRTCDPKSFVAVGAPATAPPTWLLVTYMSAQEQSSKLEAIAIKGFIIFGATVCSFPKRGRMRGVRTATIMPHVGEDAKPNFINASRGELGTEAILFGADRRTVASGPADKQPHNGVGRDGAGNGK